MFTLKFHTKETDYWEVYTANSYSSELNEQETPHVREVFIGVDGEEKITLGTEEHHFDACYVVNELGNTVDRIFPPSA